MKTRRSIEQMRGCGNNREANVLEHALSLVEAGKAPNIFVPIESRVKIDGMVFWVWDIGEELLDAYFAELRRSVDEHIKKTLEVRATVDTVRLNADKH